jgi:hypothetical protein
MEDIKVLAEFGNLKIAESKDTWRKGIKALKRNRYRVISGSDQAKALLIPSITNYMTGHLATRHGVLHTTDGSYFAPDSPLLDAGNARNAEALQSSQHEWYAPNNDVERIRGLGIKFPSEDMHIPINRLTDEEIVLVILGGGVDDVAQSQVKKIEGLLSHWDVPELNLRSLGESYVHKNNDPFIRNVHLGLSEHGVSIYGDSYTCGYLVRGIFPSDVRDSDFQ